MISHRWEIERRATGRAGLLTDGKPGEKLFSIELGPVPEEIFIDP